MKDIQRVYAKTVNSLLRLFPCVAVLGARQIGKTALLKQVFPNNLIYMILKKPVILNLFPMILYFFYIITPNL